MPQQPLPCYLIMVSWAQQGRLTDYTRDTLYTLICGSLLVIISVVSTQTPLGERACKSCLVASALQQSSQQPCQPLECQPLECQPLECQPLDMQQTLMVQSPAHETFSQCYRDVAFQRYDASGLMVEQCPVSDCQWSGGTLAELYYYEAESHHDPERTIPGHDEIPITFETD